MIRYAVAPEDGKKLEKVAKGKVFDIILFNTKLGVDGLFTCLKFNEYGKENVYTSVQSYRSSLC